MDALSHYWHLSRVFVVAGVFGFGFWRFDGLHILCLYMLALFARLTVIRLIHTIAKDIFPWATCDIA